MKTRRPIIAALLFALLSASFPLLASAQATTPTTTPPTTGAQAYQFQSDGIYGCNRTSAAASSVGAFTASGVYVPVSDAAVELNTGYLVYLFCSLRPLVSALSQSATAGMVQKILTSFNQGNNGNPQFSVNALNEDDTARDNAAVSIIAAVAGATGATFQAPITTAIARAYAASTQNPTAALGCPYSAAQISANIWTDIASIGTPSCDVLIDYENAYQQVMAVGASAVAYNTQLRQIGNGVYPLTTTDANGNVNTVTPGAIVLGQANQALQSGLLKTINAQDIGQMVSALFAGIGAQAVSSAQGLAGITQSVNGQPSYISQVATAASQNVTTNAVNDAITTLNGAVTMLTNYNNALGTVGNTLIKTIQTLQGYEAQCWTNIIANVCVSGTVHISNGAELCTQIPPPPTIVQTGSTGQGGNNTGGTQTIVPPPITLKIATTTAFSSAVIQPQIAPLVQATVPQIAAAKAGLAAVNQLVAGVTNTSSQDAQSLAIQQLDQLTASNSFPQETDVQNVEQQSTTIGQSMSTLVQTTIDNWEGLDSNTGANDISWNGQLPPNGTDIGWCNYTDKNTKSIWEALWKQ